MKKFLSLIIVFVMIISFVGCGHKKLENGSWVDAKVNGWELISRYDAKIEVIVTLSDGNRYSFENYGDDGLYVGEWIKVYFTESEEILDWKVE